MTYGLKLFSTAVLASLIMAGHSVSAEQKLKTPQDKINYSIGVSTIRNFKQYRNGNEINLKLLIQGMKDELSGKPLLMSEKELRAAITAVQTEIIQQRKSSRSLATFKNQTALSDTGTAPSSPHNGTGDSNAGSSVSSKSDQEGTE